MEIELWPDAERTERQEREWRSHQHGVRFVRNVTRPTLTPFVPDGARAAAIVCPGGGFHHLTIDNEGTDVAQRLAQRGVAAYVLKYRTVETPADDAEYEAKERAAFAMLREEGERLMAAVVAEVLPLALADALEAARVVGRSHDRVGMLGFSAGGRVTLAAAAEGGLAFAAAIYPYGAADVAPPANPPPLFVAVAADDPLVGVDDCIALYRAWPQAELHVFARGGHGFGVRRQGLPSDAWIDLFGAWLESECA